MRLKELEKLQTSYPSLKELLPKFEEYLISLSDNDDNSDVVPVIVGRHLGIDEYLALAIISLFDKAGLLKRVYQIYCVHNNTIIQEYYRKEDIPSSVYCPYHDTEEDDYELELVFQLTDKFKENYIAVSV